MPTTWGIFVLEYARIDRHPIAGLYAGAFDEGMVTQPFSSCWQNRTPATCFSIAGS